MARLSDAFAAALADLGVRKGDRLALLLPNCPQFIIAEVGAWKVGAIVTPLNPLYSEHELAGLLADSGAETEVGEVVNAWVVLHPGTAATADELRRHCQAKLAPYKVPAQVEFRHALPKTMIGKVRRRMLAEKHASQSKEGVLSCQW